MGNIFISLIKNGYNDNIDTVHFSKRNRDGYTVIKIKGIRNNLNANTDMQIRPMELTYRSELIYNVSEQQFYKNRYNVNGGNTINHLPNEIKPLFAAIIDVASLKPIDELKESHTNGNLMEALYLTNKISHYIDVFSTTEYQLVRYRYGKKVDPCYLYKLVDEYPEHLI